MDTLTLFITNVTKYLSSSLEVCTIQRRRPEHEGGGLEDGVHGRGELEVRIDRFPGNNHRP